MTKRLSVSWSAYQKNICNGFSFLQQRGEFVDMTLAADGHHVQVHKMVLCLVSSYIKELVTATQCAHPVIFLNNVSSATLEHILEYAYTGEALVPRDKIKEFLQACKSLHIKGLENTTTVHLNKESAESMCLDTRESQSVEDNDMCFDDRDDDDDVKFLDNVDDNQKLPATDETNRNITPTATHKEPTAKKPQQLKYTRRPSSDTRVQYTVSNHGHLQIILNRYIYCFNYKRIKTDEMVWRCLLYNKKCPATVVTKDGKVMHRVKAHNHTFADQAILKRLQKGLVYSELSDAQSSVQRMLDAGENKVQSTSSIV